MNGAVQPRSGYESLDASLKTVAERGDRRRLRKAGGGGEPKGKRMLEAEETRTLRSWKVSHSESSKEPRPV